MTDANLITINRRLPMDLSAFTAVASGLAQTIGLAKSFVDLKVDIETQTRINAMVNQLSELSGKFLVAQAAHIASEERAQALREEIARFNTFAAESQRYALQEIAPGAFCYVLKPECQGHEPVHYLCANCYGKKTKSILQFSGFEAGCRRLACPACGGTILIKEGKTDLAFAVATRSRRGMFDDY